jgi:hypothetical protein
MSARAQFDMNAQSGQIEKMKRKQKLHKGNRDDAVLQELDALLAGGLEYADMMDDIRNVRMQRKRVGTRTHTNKQTRIHIKTRMNKRSH